MVQLSTFIKIVAVDMFSKTMRRASNETKRTSESMNSAARSARGLSMVMSAQYLFGALQDIVKTAAAFNFTMTKVAMISNATAEEMENMTQVAKQLGKETVFTSQQVGEGMQFLAMTGLDATQIMQAMPGVVRMAAITMMDLGVAADIVTNVMKAFGLAASDTTAIADAFAFAFTNANVTLEMIGESMKYVAPIAKGLGLNFEEVTVAIMELGNAGIQGSLAGTQLRMSLLKLSKAAAESRYATLQNAQAFADYGIEIKDANGELLDSQTIALRVVTAINNSTASFEEQQQMARALGVELYKTNGELTNTARIAEDISGQVITPTRNAVQAYRELGLELTYVAEDGTEKMKSMAEIIEEFYVATGRSGDLTIDQLSALRSIVGVRGVAAWQVLIREGPEAFNERLEQMKFTEFKGALQVMYGAGADIGAVVDEMALAMQNGTLTALELEEQLIAAGASEMVAAEMAQMLMNSVNEGTASVNEFKEGVNNANTSIDMGNRAMNTAQGAMLIYENRVENLKIAMGEHLFPVLIKMLDILGKMIDVYYGLPEPLQKATPYILAATVAVIGLYGAFMLLGSSPVVMGILAVIAAVYLFAWFLNNASPLQKFIAAVTLALIGLAFAIAAVMLASAPVSGPLMLIGVILGFLLPLIIAVTHAFFGSGLGTAMMIVADIAKVMLMPQLLMLKGIFEGIKLVVEGVTAVLEKMVETAKSAANAVKGIPGVGTATSGISSGLGSIGGALGFQQGGIVPGPRGAPVPAIVHGGERVIPNDEADVGRGEGGINITVNGNITQDDFFDMLDRYLDERERSKFNRR